MKLERLTERVWIYPFEQERDRPNLGYIRGDRWSLAVDAGHSAAHTAAFYKALEEAGLPLPSLTVLTHWHWDHTFGMHAVHGLTLANQRTNEYLRAFRDRLGKEGVNVFYSLHESVRREYAGGRPVIVTLADLAFSGEMRLDPGGCPVRVLEVPAPHTDDSSLVFAEGEKMLFVSDAACGAFPDWEKDGALSAKLAQAVRDLDADICLEGHWTPVSKEEMLSEILSEEG